MTREAARRDALTQLMALPDEPCLRRGNVYVQQRDFRRDPEVIKRDLGTAYVGHRRQDHEDISHVVAVRRLRLARRA